MSNETLSTKSSSLESSEGNYINAYNFLKDRYYFIDEYFKAQYYPLDLLNKHNFLQHYTIIEHEVWKMIDSQKEFVEEFFTFPDLREHGKGYEEHLQDSLIFIKRSYDHLLLF